MEKDLLVDPKCLMFRMDNNKRTDILLRIKVLLKFYNADPHISKTIVSLT